MDDKCGFCHTGEENESICGTLHKDKIDGKIICAHHKCMQYSACLVQYKLDDFGGFKKHEVQKEIRRGGKLTCSICKSKKSVKNKKGATSGCALAACRKTFHYLCVSLNPNAVAKRYRVEAGGKIRVLYRVFCSHQHESHYKETLSADDIVGKNHSSDEEDDDDDKDDGDDEVSAGDKSDHSEASESPPRKKLRQEDGAKMTNPTMSTEEVITETKKQYSELLHKQKNGNSHKHNRDSVTTASTESHDGSESSTVEQAIPHTDGYVIVIPSSLEGADLKSVCTKAGKTIEQCQIWPKSYMNVGLKDKHMPFLMWSVTMQLRDSSGEDLVNVFSSINPAQFEVMASIHNHLTGDSCAYKQLISMCDVLNCKFNSEVCRLVRMSDQMYYLLLSLPKSLLSKYDIWSAIQVHRWTLNTVVSRFQETRSAQSSEKKILMNWLMPLLVNKSCEITAYPKEGTLRLAKPPKNYSVAREIEFSLENITMSNLSTSVVKILVLRNVNREVVNFKAYLHRLLENFLHENNEFECFCVVEVLPSDALTRLEDVLTEDMGVDSHVQLHSAFHPQNHPVTCLVLHTTTYKAEAGSSILPMQQENGFGSPSLYLDCDETPTNTNYC